VNTVPQCGPANEPASFKVFTNYVALPKKPVKRHSIFPGNVRQKTADEQPASWDESQWID